MQACRAGKGFLAPASLSSGVGQVLWVPHLSQQIAAQHWLWTLGLCWSKHTEPQGLKCRQGTFISQRPVLGGGLSCV